MRIRTALFFLAAGLVAAETTRAARANAAGDPRAKPAPSARAEPPPETRAEAEPAADAAATFEALAGDALPMADVGTVLGALLDRCPDDKRTVDRARCRASLSYLRQALPDQSFAITVEDPAAISVSDYDEAIKGYRVGLSACVACTAPMRVGRLPDPVFITLKKPAEPARAGEALAAAVEITTQPIAFASDAEARRWLRSTRPHLRAELILSGTASEWRFRSMRGYALPLVAGRIVDGCTGAVVLSTPPSTGHGLRSAPASSAGTPGRPAAEGCPAAARPNPVRSGSPASPAATTDEAGDSGDDEERPLPGELSRSAIAEAMGQIRTQIFACFQQYRVPGAAPLTYEVAGNGLIQSVRLAGPLAGTPTADCLLEAARSARFPRFDGPVQTFTYPFFLRR